jgi:hypothetical protein
MKLNSHSNKLETNVQDNETQNFGIGDASVVIDILRNRLYEHKVQTLVQEYICNARDAMRELGKGAEFEVTVPTQLNPVFKVRDFGPGITPDRMKNVFVMYGSSTKRGNDTQTGGFGIGAKSAWSYTDSFTIVTYIDGVKRAYVAHTGVNNNGRLDQVSVGETDEANGTEIQVPVNKHDIDEFREAIFRAIYFWEVKPTLKGELDIPTLAEGYRLGDVEIIDARMVPAYIGLDSYRQDMLAVIDGVVYPIGAKLIEKCNKLRHLKSLATKPIILRFGNGIVEVSASRESIADSKYSLEALEKIATKAVVSIKTHITNSFGKVKSTAEFFETYRDLSKYFHVEAFANYGIYRIRNGSVESDLFKKVKITRMTNIGRRGQTGDRIFKTEMSETRSEIRIEDIDKLYFLKAQESVVLQNRRLKEYFKTKKVLILLEPKGDDVASLDQMITDFGGKDLQSLVWYPKPKAERVEVERDKEQFCVHALSRNGREHEYMTLETVDKTWIYVPMVDASWGKHDPELLKELSIHLISHKIGQVCGIAPRTVKKVQGNENFIPLEEFLKEFKPNNKQLNYAKNVVAKNLDEMKLIARLEGLNDKDLSEMAKEYKDMGKTESVPSMLMNLIHKTDEFKEFEEKDKELTKSLKKYPLLKEISSWCKYEDDVVVYLNAKYKVA